jgi:dienelactone hydrolase
MKRMISLRLIFVGATLTGAIAAPSAEEQLMRSLDRAAQAQLDARASEIGSIDTVEAAERRKQVVRMKLLESLGGLPEYSGPLNAKVTGQIEKNGYVIEKVIFESLPGFHVTGNVYRPARRGRHPGVLIALGHWDEGKMAEQQTAANLALKGFVALAYDPIGQGERIQAYDRRIGKTLGGWSVELHFQAGAQSLLAGESFARYMIWDAKRSLDYLVSRPDVDPERIGATGCSGGGALTTYIAALDSRVKAAAPACWMNSYRTLFTGPVGDSEQSLPSFLASGLDQTDYVELFAPKPWLVVSTIGDFFPLEGARQISEEARRWYRIYGAADRFDWVAGPGPHGTPREVRERIYDWMIRWLKDGQGDSREETVDLAPSHQLLATPTGQVTVDLASREIYQVIRESFQERKAKETSKPGDVRDELARLMRPLREGPLSHRVLEERREPDWVEQKILVETEPGLESHGTLLIARGAGRKPGVLVVETGETRSAVAEEAARRGAVVLALAPRGLPRSDDRRPFAADYAMNTRALLVGRTLPGMRAFDIQRGIDLLSARSDVDTASIRAIARNEPGVWLLMAAAIDRRIQRIWLDKTPHSFRIVFDEPLNRNLYMSLIRGFGLKWDLSDLVTAMNGRKVIWTDPTNWMGVIVQPAGDFQYRPYTVGDGRYLDQLMR